VQEAYYQARALQKFFNDHNPVYGLFDIPFNVRNTFDAVVGELDAHRKTYSKPKDNGQINERDFRDQLVRGLYREFDACSVTLLSALLGLVDYELNQRELAKVIAELLGPLKIQRARRLGEAIAKSTRGGA
jgi:hypothetical protein